MTSNISQNNSTIDINDLYDMRSFNIYEQFNKFINLLDNDKSNTVINTYIKMANILVNRAYSITNKNIKNILTDNKKDDFTKLNTLNSLSHNIPDGELKSLVKNLNSYQESNKHIHNKIYEYNKKVESSMDLIPKIKKKNTNKKIIETKKNVLWSKLEGRLCSEYTRKVDKNKYLRTKTNNITNIQIIDIDGYKIRIPSCVTFIKSPTNMISYSLETKSFFININNSTYTLGPSDFIMNIYNNESFIKGNKLKRTVRCDLPRNKCRYNCTYYHDPVVDLKWSHSDRLFTKGYIVSLLSMIQNNKTIHKNFNNRNNENRLRDLYQLGGSIIIKAMIIDQLYN